MKDFSHGDSGIIEDEMTSYEGRACRTTINRARSTQSFRTCQFAKDRRAICRHIIASCFVNAPNNTKSLQRKQKRVGRRASGKNADDPKARVMLVDLLYREAEDRHYRIRYLRKR